MPGPVPGLSQAGRYVPCPRREIPDSSGTPHTRTRRAPSLGSGLRRRRVDYARCPVRCPARREPDVSRLARGLGHCVYPFWPIGGGCGVFTRLVRRYPIRWICLFTLSPPRLLWCARARLHPTTIRRLNPAGRWRRCSCSGSSVISSVIGPPSAVHAVEYHREAREREVQDPPPSTARFEQGSFRCFVRSFASLPLQHPSGDLDADPPRLPRRPIACSPTSAICCGRP